MSTPDVKKFSVLYVDDEEQALKYFPILFKDFRCLTANSAREARAIFAAQGDSIGVLITDQRMPGESGVDLLTWVRSAYPRVVRILTTAYTDIDSAIASVNSGEIYRYVVKPWNARELVGILMHAMEWHIIARERDSLLREKLSTLQTLVMLDRVRAFAVLAAGLTPRLQNTLTALKSYIEQAPAPGGDGGSPSLDGGDPYARVQAESRRLVDLTQAISRDVAADAPRFTVQPLGDLLAPARALAGAHGPAAVAVELQTTVTAITSDGHLVARLFALLAAEALAVDPAAPRLDIRVADGPPLQGQRSVAVTVRTGGAPWTPAQHAGLYATLSFAGGVQPHPARLLSATFIAHHHGGQVDVHPQGPAGPGFTVTLPVDARAQAPSAVPSAWVDDILTFQRDS
jgi:two-component system probable response regulator PhcQ